MDKIEKIIKRLLHIFGIHDWSSWKDYTDVMYMVRFCKICHETQDIKINKE